MIPLATQNDIAGYSPLAFLVIVLVLVILVAVALKLISKL